jgi:hypothetical protein
MTSCVEALARSKNCLLWPQVNYLEQGWLVQLRTLEFVGFRLHWDLILRRFGALGDDSDFSGGRNFRKFPSIRSHC